MPYLKKRRFAHLSPTSEASSAQFSPNNHSAKRHHTEIERARRKCPRTPKLTPEYEQFISDFKAAVNARFGRTTSTGFVRRAEGELQLMMSERSASFRFFSASAHLMEVTEYDFPLPDNDLMRDTNGMMATSEGGSSSSSGQSDSESQSDSSMMATSEDESSSNSEESDSDDEAESLGRKPQFFPTPIKNKSARMPSRIDGLEYGFAQSGTPVRSRFFPARFNDEKVFSHLSGAIGEESFEFALYQKDNNYHKFTIKNPPAHLFESEAKAALRQKKKTQGKSAKKPHEWSDARKKKVLESQLAEAKQVIEFSGVFNRDSRSQAKKTDTSSKKISVNNFVTAQHMALSRMDFEEYKDYQLSEVEDAERVRHAWYHLVPACLGGAAAVSKPQSTMDDNLLVAATEGANHAKLALELAVLNYIKKNPGAEISFLVQVVNGIETTTLSHQDKKLVVSHALMDPNYPTGDYIKLIYRLFHAIFDTTSEKEAKLAEILGSVRVRMMPEVSQERRAPVSSGPRSKFFGLGAQGLNRVPSLLRSLSSF